MWTSKDGKSWTLRRLPPLNNDLSGTLTHLAEHNGVLVAVGRKYNKDGALPFAFASADGGASWQQLEIPKAGSNVFVTALTATSRGFVISGTAGDEQSADVVLWTSADGRRWTLDRPQGAGLSGQGWQGLAGLAALRNRLIAVGAVAGQQTTEPTLWDRPLP